MKRWTAIGNKEEEARWQLFSRFVNEAGKPNEFVPWPGDPEAFSSLEQLNGFEYVRLATRLSPRLIPLLKVQSSWTTMLGVMDGLVVSAGQWWPLCALYEAFGQTLIELGQNLDTKGNVLIAGAGGAARSAIAAFFKAGFQKFLITNQRADEAQTMINEVQRRFFGLDLKWVPTEQIVLLPGDTSVLVNCTPSVQENDLLTELSYMNFLRRSGALFDLSRTSKPSLLVSEAVESEVTVIDGNEIGARTDLLWAKWAFQCDLDGERYRREFASLLS